MSNIDNKPKLNIQAETEIQNQKINVDKTVINMDTTNSEFNMNTHINNVSPVKNSSLSLQTKIIIGMIIFLIILAAILLPIFVRKKDDDKKRNFINYETNEVSTTEILDTELNTIISDTELNTIISDTELTTTKITDSYEITPIDYIEAESLIDSEIVNETHNLLNENYNNAEELILMCNNSNLSKINVTVNSIPDNLDELLKNINQSSIGSLQVFKYDLNLYNDKYTSLSQEVDILSAETLASFKFLSTQFDEFKNSIYNITNNFEETIGILAIPLSLNLTENGTNLRYLDNDDNKDLKNKILDWIDEFKGLKELLGEIEKITKNWKSLMKIVYESLFYIQERSIAGISNFNEFLDVVIGGTIKMVINEILMRLKESLLSIKNKVDDYLEIIKKILNELIEITENLKYKLDSFIKEHPEIITKLNDFIKEISENSEIMIPALKPISQEIFIQIQKCIKFILNIFTGIKNKIEDFTGIFDIELSTSLDLLFIMDVTGSMGPYIREVKTNLLNIIDGIVKECPGININLGFIGYRDYYENYTDIDFIQDPEHLKNIINSVYASGGGDFPEDVSLAFELALKKTWKNNARLAVFIADAPEHGKKYGYSDYYGTKPERRDLEEMIIEMAQKGISLFCLRIRRETDIMLKIFQDIYMAEKANNTQFQIVDNKDISLSKVVIDYAIKVYNEQRISNDNCLISKDEAISILKTQYGITNSNPDDNLRFILGKCSPVLLVPGVYATKLVVELNCHEITTYEKDTTLKDIRLYCSYLVCLDESNRKEEHSLLISFLDEAFGIEGSRDYNYGACLGHIATYYQNENECPRTNRKDTCHYSKYIKVGYYGGTSETLKNSRCGVEGITNVIQTGDLLLDSVLNSVVGISGSFNLISKNLIHRGYKEGFSLGALPNDYRRYLYTNNFASKVFEYQINRLYQNTGKPVVVVAHSYGTLLTLTNLLKKQGDTSFMKKIKKFIAMAPPFAGSTKLLDVFLHGTNDFNKIFKTNFYDLDIKIYLTHYSLFGQYLMYKSLPTIMELRPQPIAAQIFTDSTYSELGTALRDRLDIEKKCKNKNCDITEIENKTSSFDYLFKGYFPSLLDSECSYESNIGGNQKTLNRKCYTNIYNIGDCPTIIPKSIDPKEYKFEDDAYCNNFETNFYYQGKCNINKRNCLDKVYYSNQCPNVFSDTKIVQYLLARFNTDPLKVARYGFLNEDYFDSYEDIKDSFKNLLEYQNKISSIKDLPVPPIDTDLIYGSFYPTLASLVLDDDDFTKESSIEFKKGGDETVPTWSSLLTGLKWIYDIKSKKLPQKIKLVEYCSRLAKSGQYKYDPSKNQNFSAISCRCIDGDNVYKNEDEIKQCSHASMLQDENLFKYIFSVLNDQNENINFADSKKQAVNNYDKKVDYSEQCSKDIYDFLDKEDPIIIKDDSKSVNQIMKSTCKIILDQGEQKKEGKGFLISSFISGLDNPIRGIMTTNSILNTNISYNSKIKLICDEKDTEIYIIPKENFCFSDPFIDITFIELKNSEYDKLNFVKVEKIDFNSKNFYIVKNIKDKEIIKGAISNRYGFKLEHGISLDDTYFGSALVSLDDNTIIGIYKSSKTAINIEPGIEGIKILYNSYYGSKSAFNKIDGGFIQKGLKILNDAEINELKNHGLFPLTTEIFITRATISVTMLWFYRTNYAWYWTPVNPKNNDIEISNWLIVCPGCSLKVIGSEWNGNEPYETNIDLIHWLEGTGLTYLV